MTRFQGFGLRWFGAALACLLVQPCLAQDTGGSATLIVEVPEDAKVEVNGYLTRASGTHREFAPVGLEPGYHYDYRIRAEVVREGRTLEQVRTARLAVGETVRVVFPPFDAASHVKSKDATSTPKGPPIKSKVQEPPIEPKVQGPAIEPKPKGPAIEPEPKKSTSAQSQVPLTSPGAATPPATAKKPPEPNPAAAKTPEGKPPEKKPTDTPPPEKKPSEPASQPKETSKTGPPSPPRPPHKQPPVEKYLLNGNLAEGERAMAARLKENTRDDEARFSLGGVQFLRAVERLLQSLYYYGLRSPSEGPLGAELPLLRVPVAANPTPKPLSYLQAREILKAFLDDLAKAEATLAPIRDEQVNLPIHVLRIQLDVRGDGDLAKTESLWQIYARLAGQPALSEADARELVVCFDRGDAYWLRGYCHLLMALGEMVLAYDEQEFFERTAFLLFPNVVPSSRSLVVVPSNRSLVSEPSENSRGVEAMVDLVAVAHLARFTVYEPERMGRALEHLQTAVAMSRASWQAILAETDDDCEWIPNPDQHGAIPGVEVTRPMVDAWGRFLNEAEALLAGKKLAPYWRRLPAVKPAEGPDAGPGEESGIKRPAASPRPADQRGVNLNWLFTQPQPFDLILWVQGSGVAPYLDKGAVVDPQVWRQIGEAFGGDFLLFALWFN